MPRLELTVLLGLALPFGPVGCSSLSSTTTGGITPAPTTIIIDPSAFLGDVPCGTGAGDLKRYVATLVDVTPDAGADDEIPSSLPSPCFKEVAFVKTTFTSHDAATAPVTILDGHEYEAQIDGYDTNAIAPQSTGSRTMVDATKAVVPSRWTATCGGKETPLDAGADAAPVTATDAATGSYGACRAALAPDGGATGDLTGPVCAFEGLTLVMRHCTPLRPR